MDHTSSSQARLGDHIQITDITIRFLGKCTPSTKLEVFVDRKKYETGAPTSDEDSRTLKWTFERSPIPVWSGEVVRIQAYCHKMPIYLVNRKKCDEIKICAEELEQLFNSELVKTVHAITLQECEVTLGITRATFSPPKQVSDEDIPNIPNFPVSPEAVAKQITSMSSILDDFGKSFECIGKIVKVVEGLSSVHPFAEVAVVALSAAYKALQKAKAFNNDLRDLAKEMRWLLSLLAEQDCAKIEVVKDIFIEIMKKIQDVSRYIEAYLRKQSVARVTSALLSGTELVGFKNDLISLGRKLRTAMPVQIAGQVDKVAIRMDHVADGVSTIAHNVATAEEERILARLRPVEKWPFVAPCLEGTRKDVLDTIDEWVGSSDGPNILWVNGSPGAGKSAIASTMVSRLRQRGLLGSRFFFKSGDAKMGTPTSLWSDVAFGLAKFDPSIREGIVAACANDKTGLDSADVELHFKALVQEVLLPNHPPSTTHFVVVIDALDECTPSSQDPQRRMLLNTLKAWAHLPSTFKLLVTSRNEHEINASLHDVSQHILLQVGVDVSAQSSHDIRTFFHDRFGRVVKDYPTLPLNWPGATVVDQLTARAAGLFIWAETVIKWIQEFDPVGTLEEVLSGHEEGETLDTLYSRIVARFTSTKRKEAFKEVVGCIIVARNLLHLDDLKVLLGRSDTWVDSILKDLSSVISQDSSGRLYIGHLSFADFVTDVKRCGPEFYIDQSLHNLTLGRSCLRMMNGGLKFNIFEIESSYTMNKDIPDLSARIQRYIPSPLRYACSFWYQHLERSANDVPTLRLVEDFMDEHFLHWVEVLSLTDQIRPAILGLRSVGSIVQDANKELYTVLTDASRFVTLVSAMEPASVPHIYLSALPCSPSSSRVSAHFSARCPRTLVVEAGRDSEWSANVMALKGHEKEVRSVAFSPDGRVIASGSKDATIRIWDVQTGQQISEPLRGHSHWVHCVAFSPEGKYIASGSLDGIRIWDVRTGQANGGSDEAIDNDDVHSVAFSRDGKYLASGSSKGIRIWHFQDGRISQPFAGHVHGDWVYSIAFSHDGRYLVSGSYDETICVWDVQLRREAFAPFRGHENWVRCVAFSPDGQFIASGSDDKTIRVWNAQTGQQAYEPLEGHASAVCCIIFSTDGSHLVSGSLDKTVRIWNIDTGQQVSSLEHRSNVNSVTLSPDGRFVASASDDDMVHIWDASTCHRVPESLEKHDEAINSVAFSLDGAYVASGSDDGTVRVWDVKTSRQVYGPFEGHTGGVTSVVFSPNGKSIASGSVDRTVRIWNVHASQRTFEPFEGHGDSVRAVSFSPDGRYIVSGSEDYTVRLWDVGSQQALKTFEGHESHVYSVAFSPDGKYVISGSKDNTVRVWDVHADQQVGEPFRGHVDWVRAVVFSPDGRYVASGSDDRTVCVWDARTRQLSKMLEGHEHYVYSVAFSPDGRYVVSGSGDYTVRVWDVDTGRQALEPLEGHLSWVLSVAFSPDGKYVVSGSWDETIRIWDITPRHDATLDHSWHVPDIQHDPGWVYSHSEYKKPLFWLPRQYFTGKGLFWPRTKTVLGARPVKIDLTKFVHGTSWTDCQTPLQS